MLLGYNTLEYYNNKSEQIWLTSDNQNIVMLFNNGVVPQFVLISDLAMVSATIGIYNAYSDIQVGDNFNAIISNNEDAIQLKFLGNNIVDENDGYYYSKITTNNNDIIYSSVFAWNSNNNLDILNISAISANIKIANTYTIDLTGITFNSYVFADKGDIDIDIVEEGIDKPNGIEIKFNTSNTLNLFEITGNRNLYKYIKILRTISINGVVNFQYNNVIMNNCNNIVVEKKESTDFGKFMIFILEFRENNFISSINNI